MFTDPRVSACIVLYHAPKEVLQTVRCLQNATTPLTLFVVDNSPRDDTARNILTQCSHAHISRSEHNLGYAAGNNKVLKKLKSDYHLILNPDVTFEPDVIQRMVAFMDAHPDVMVLTPRVLNVDGTEQYLPKLRPTIRFLLGGPLARRGERKKAKGEKLTQTARTAAEAAQAARSRYENGKHRGPSDLLRLAALNVRAGHLRRKAERLIRQGEQMGAWRAAYTLANDPPKGPVAVQFATGCFLMIRTRLFYRLGGFDDHYFLYHEDSDLSMQVLRYGKIIYHPDICVTHAWQRDSSRKFLLRLVHIKSTIRFFNKWGWKW